MKDLYQHGQEVRRSKIGYLDCVPIVLVMQQPIKTNEYSYCFLLRNPLVSWSTQLGSGAFGAVYIGLHKMATAPKGDSDSLSPAWKNVAIKKSEPNLLDRRGGRIFRTYDDYEKHCQEIKTLLRLQDNRGSLNYSKVLHMQEFFLSGRNFFMITELLGEELDQFRMSCKCFTEKMAINICRTILDAIAFMASKGVVHRDIKMPNILFRKNGDSRTLTIVDFGLAQVLEEGETAKDFCGTPGCIAPEMYSGNPYRFEGDMFAFGVLLFRLLSGERPFPSHNSEILELHTVQLRYNVQGQDWENVSSSAKDLVRHLLINRNDRLTAEQALAHQWFLEDNSSRLRVDMSYCRPATRSRSKAFARVSLQLDLTCRLSALPMEGSLLTLSFSSILFCSIMRSLMCPLRLFVVWKVGSVFGWRTRSTWPWLQLFRPAFIMGA